MEIHQREVCFLIGHGQCVIDAVIADSPVSIPDSRSRWQAIWQNRDNLIEIAHSHPLGNSQFSSEDESTMLALDAALGRHLRYSVISSTAVRVRTGDAEQLLTTDPWWVALMRAASGMI